MCRWIAYRGETTAFEHYVTEPEHSLVSQSLRALEATKWYERRRLRLGVVWRSSRTRSLPGNPACLVG